MILEKLNEILNEETQLFYVRGQMLKPGKHMSKEGETYYSFFLKEVNPKSDNKYQENKNMYYIIITKPLSNKLTDADIKQMKGNEVACLVSLKNYAKTLRSKQTDEDYVVNSSSYFALELMQTNELDNTRQVTKVINL